MWTACCCWLLLAFVETNPRRLQVLYLDSDNLPLLDPGFMFDWDAFKVNGAVFWPDYVGANQHEVTLCPPTFLSLTAYQWYVRLRNEGLGAVVILAPQIRASGKPLAQSAQTSFLA